MRASLGKAPHWFIAAACTGVGRATHWLVRHRQATDASPGRHSCRVPSNSPTGRGTEGCLFGRPAHMTLYCAITSKLSSSLGTNTCHEG